MQGDLEVALSKLLDREVSTVCAGRTDVGVHALAQVVSFADAPADLDLDKIREAINAICGPSIAVHACRHVVDGFSARFSARSRTYVYAIYEGAVVDPFLARTTLHRRGRLDVDAMKEAAGSLLGPHDFSSFGRVREPQASAERVLYELSSDRDGELVRVRARANAFIQQMARSIVGTLIQVGEGARAPDEMEEILAARDRSAAGPVAPPHGLCLVAVEYDEGWSLPARTSDRV